MPAIICPNRQYFCPRTKICVSEFLYPRTERANHFSILYSLIDLYSRALISQFGNFYVFVNPYYYKNVSITFSMITHIIIHIIKKKIKLLFLHYTDYLPLILHNINKKIRTKSCMTYLCKLDKPKGYSFSLRKFHMPHKKS